MRLAECDARLLQTCRLGRRSLSLGSFGHLQRHPIGMRTSQTRLYVLLIPPSFCYSSAIFPDFLISFLESPDLLVAFTEIPYLFTQRLYYSQWHIIPTILSGFLVLASLKSALFLRFIILLIQLQIFYRLSSFMLSCPNPLVRSSSSGLAFRLLMTNSFSN